MRKTALLLSVLALCACGGKAGYSIPGPSAPSSGEEPAEPWSDVPTLSFGTPVTVRPGVEWTSFHGVWEGEVRNINIVRTALNEQNRLGLYYNYSTEGLLYLDEKCEYLGAVAGTNGPMACCQFSRVDGIVRRSATNTSANPWIANCALAIDDRNAVDIVKVADNYGAALLDVRNVGCAGPLLVWEGKIQPASAAWLAADSGKWLTTTHPRTAIGLSRDRRSVIQVAVDGRWDRSAADERAIGMSTDLLAKLMKGLGCYKAMNFDGGGGTAMYVRGYGNARNIVNRVSENRWDWNGTTLRSTGNAVYVY